jgi:hypothetical protein
MSQSTRLESLQTRHSELSNQIREERKHPAADEGRIKKLKIERLALKNQIHDIG